MYLCGPMTGYPAFNYPAFFAAADALRVARLEPLNPAELGDKLGSAPWATYMRCAIAMLVKAEAVVMLDGWAQSRGALLERQIADAVQIPVYSSVAMVAAAYSGE